MKEKRQSLSESMRTIHMIGEDGTFTNLAFLLSEQCTHMVKLAVFEGSKKSVFKDRTELSGSLLEQLEAVFDYINRYKEERVEAVVSLCRKNGFVVRKDIEQALHVSQATAILLLREMVADGLLTKKGAAKTLRYYLTAL